MMKTKTIFAGLLSGILCLTLFSGCGGSDTSGASDKGDSSASGDSSVSAVSDDKSSAASQEKDTDQESSGTTQKGTGHTLLIRDAGKSDKMTATFFNTMSDATAEIEMTKAEEGDDHITYSCEGDTSLYNMVRLTYGAGKVSTDVSFNSYVAGWYLKDDTLLPYAEGMDLRYDPAFDTKVFQFDGVDKEVYIWTPENYDKDSSDKYSTVYMFDGQTVLATGRDRGMDSDTECWNVSESVAGMMSVTDNKTILVCITDVDNRADELVPDLGTVAASLDTKKRGSAFADFICDTIVPYVRDNYNVYPDAQHTALAGSSLGGLETFYTVLTHPDTFSAGGVLSASFHVYDDATWETFLSDKTNLENAPFLYFYAGGYAVDNGGVNETRYNYLLENGYPKDKLVFNKFESGRHMVQYWRNIYSEFLQAAFQKKVDALTCGTAVKYEDNYNPFENIPVEASIDPDDPRLNDKNNYIFFDNSKTKWDQVYAYWWDAIPTNKISGGLYGGEWPGVKMEQIEGTDIYRMVMPMGPSKIIFSSGVTDTEVINGVTAYQTENMPYDDQLNAGQIFTIDTTQEATPEKVEKYKTKFKYPAGSWSDYNGNM